MSDGKEAKFIFVDEFHSTQGGFFKMPNGSYAHYSCGNPEKESELAKKLGKGKVKTRIPLSIVMSKGDLDKFTKKEQDNEQNSK